MTNESGPDDTAAQVARAWGNDLFAARDIHLRGQYVAGRDIDITVHPPEERSAPALHQLPYDAVDFVDRQAKLDDIIEAANTSALAGSPIIAISGKPGVGKSALAIKAAHLLTSTFPDAQLFINLLGEDQQSLTPEEALDQILATLGIPQDKSVTLRTLALRYRAGLAGKRVLVVLDNAKDPAQLEPLLPGNSTCAVIATSREPLTAIDGVRQLPLDVLPESESIALLSAIVGERIRREQVPAQLVGRLCGHLPLALKIAGARLAGSPHWTVDDLARRLADEQRRLDELKLGHREVRASFKLSYDWLDESARAAFRRLAGLRLNDFDRALAEYVLKSSEQEVDNLLEELTQAQLIDARRSGQFGVRYNFHSLIRLFALERLGLEEAPELRNVVKRGVEWYLSGIREATAMLRIQGETSPEEEHEALSKKHSALAWLDEQYPNLTLIINQAAELELWDEAAIMATNLGEYLMLRGRLGTLIHTQELAIHASKKAGDRHVEGVALHNLGSAYTQIGDTRRARKCLTGSLRIKRRTGDRLGEIQTLTNLAGADLEAGSFKEAIQHLSDSLGMAREVGSQTEQGRYLLNLAAGYMQAGNLEKARQYLDEAPPPCLIGTTKEGSRQLS
jgi:tetratricopeptide (TPR) repeat protein